MFDKFLDCLDWIEENKKLLFIIGILLIILFLLWNFGAWNWANCHANLLSAIGSLSAVLFSLWFAVWRNPRKSYVKIKNIHFIKIQKTNNNNDDIYFSFEVENNSDFDLTINDIYIFYKKQNLYIKLIDFYLRNNHVYSNKTIKPKNKSEIECRINFILQKGSLKFENLEKSVHYNSYKITIPDIKSIDKYLRYKPYKIIIKNSLYDKKIRITRKQWKRFKKEILEYIEKFNIK